jgi:tRNA nucleotidyltransferase/poly(A) polymerase
VTEGEQLAGRPAAEPPRGPSDVALGLLRAALVDGPPAWIVGGAVRERLRGRPTDDLDVAIDGADEARRVAREVARSGRGHAFALSDAFGAWRVAGPDPGDGAAWQLDLTPLQGPDLDADLRCRDLTVNALAEPVAGGPLVDRFGGREDLERGVLRMVTSEAFSADPVRVVRLARFAAELGMAPEPATVAAARAAAPGLVEVPGERLLPELTRTMASPAWAAGLGVAEATGVLVALLPAATTAAGELRPRVRELLEAVLDPLAHVPEAAPDDALALAARRDDPASRAVLGLAALLVAAPDPAAALDPLRPSRQLRTAVARAARLPRQLTALTGAELSDRQLFELVRPLGPDGPEAILVARAFLGPHAAPWTALSARAVRWAERPPTAPVRGDALAEALGIRPGRTLGKLLEELAIAADTGRIGSQDEAIALARLLHAAEAQGETDG